METLSIGIVAKTKHGDLLRAMAELGWTQADLARYLECTQTEIGRLCNMHGRPSKEWLSRCDRERKLLELTGKLAEDIWPTWATTEVLSELPKKAVQIVDVSSAQLSSARELLALPPHQELEVDRQTARNQIDAALKTLTPREDRVMRAVWLEEKPRRDVASQENITVSRIRQIEQKAFRKLRHASRAKKYGLGNCLDAM